jgi:RimJ/RimL family protein N-acetyltransferase
VHIDTSQSAALFKLANERLGGHFSHEKGHKVMTLLGQRGIESQAVFTNVHPGAKAELSLWAAGNRGLAGRRFMRAICRVVFGYADGQWGCARLHAVTRESNTRAQRALIGMGFTFEASLKNWFGDEPGLMFRMLRGECRWLKE